MKKLLLLVLSLVLIACNQPIEQTARDSVATAKGYLDSARQHHPECQPNSTGAVCQIISRGVAAKDAVIDAVDIYCASPQYSEQGGPCAPNKDAAQKLKEALKNLSTIMTDVKGVVK